MATTTQLVQLVETNDSTKQLFFQALKSIDINDIETLKSILVQLPVDKLGAEDSSKLLNILLDQCRNNRSRKIFVEAIFNEYIGRVYSTVEDLEFLSSLYFDHSISVDNLSYLSTMFTDDTFFSIAEDLSQYDLGDRTTEACYRLDQVFPKQSEQTYRTLIELCYNINNFSMYNFFMGCLKEVTDYSPIPEWVDSTLIFTAAQVEDIIKSKRKVINIKANDETVRRIVDLIVNHAKESPYLSVQKDLGELRDEIQTYFDSLTQERKDLIIKDKYNELSNYELQNDVELFRLLGPANPPINSKSDELELGGARMFEDGSWDYDEDDQLVHWFNGNCDFCGNKIRKECHAIRRPMMTGGWKGCFCSISCLKNDLKKDECTSGEPDLITRNLVDVTIERLKQFGIQDRD